MNIFQNKVLMTAILGWIIAIIAKFIITSVVNRKLEWKKGVSDGGMPSSHSALVSSVAAALYFECGPASPVFALAAVFALITMHDASGVRLESGKQAKAINDIVEILSPQFEKLSDEDKLKEILGHTPFQVLVGALFGIVTAVIMYN